MDYLRELLLYQTAGVREYWIVDPENSIVTVYNFKKETVEKYSFGVDILKFAKQICEFVLQILRQGSTRAFL